MCSPTNWREQAACRRTSPLVFETDGRVGEAHRICSVCPVRAECLDEALRLRDTHGFRGGHTGDERAALLRRARRPRARVPVPEVYRLTDLGWDMRAIAAKVGVHVDSVRRVLKLRDQQQEAA